jgi:anti-anti-sigma regulatory factor
MAIPGAARDAATSCDDGTATIVLVGEFDMSSTAHFWASVSEVLGSALPSITVEARGLTFIDSWGPVGVAASP